MEKFTREELDEALRIVTSAIGRCEKMQPKFSEDTSQDTLLKNRLKALHISKSLLTDESAIDRFSKEELVEALRPISSIVSKCEKALLRFEEGNAHHTCFQTMVRAMNISKSLITNEIDKRG